MRLGNFVRPRERLRVVADVLGRPDKYPDGERDQERQGIKEVKVTFVTSQITVVAEGEDCKVSIGTS